MDSQQVNSSRQEERLFGREISNVVDPPGFLTRRESTRPSYGRRRQKMASRGASDDTTKRVLNDVKYIKLAADEPKDKLKNLSFRENKVTPLQSLTNSISLTPEGIEMVPEYFSDCYKHMIEREKSEQLIPNYFSKQKDISKNMREIVIDWIVELHLRFRMFPCTLFQTIHLLDRYLAKTDVPRTKLQLVATTCFYIAAKYEETYEVPTLKDLVALAAKSFTREDILQTQSQILEALDFNLLVDTCYQFFQPLAKLIKMDTKNVFLCRYVLQLSLFQVGMFKYKQSLIGAACIYLINKIRKKTLIWHETLEELTGYSQSHIRTCAKQLCLILQNANNLPNAKALRRKFSQSEFYGVTNIRLQKREKQQ